MTARLSLAALVLVATGATFGARPSPTAMAASEPPAGQDVSTLDDQTELSITVYNSDLALVRDVRSVQLARGTFDLRFMDIAATVNPATVHVRSLTEPARLGVLEQNYEYDLLEPEKLLRKYVGRDVTLVRLASGRRRDARGRPSPRGFSATTISRSGGLATRSSPASMPITSASRSCPAISTRARR